MYQCDTDTADTSLMYVCVCVCQICEIRVILLRIHYCIWRLYSRYWQHRDMARHRGFTERQKHNAAKT